MLDFLKSIVCGPWWTRPLGCSSLVGGMDKAREGPEQCSLSDAQGKCPLVQSSRAVLCQRWRLGSDTQEIQ